jgi:CPA2 family monovalent cation:H+ antiporter-2
MALEFESAGIRDALVVLGAAGLVIPAFARFRISPVIGFILVGILVGPFGLGALASRAPWLDWVTISKPDAIAPFAELGIILLLFSIGLELSFNRLWSMRRRIFGFGAVEMIGSAVLIAIALALAGQTMGAAIGLGLALALSSTALVIPIAGRTTPVGRLAFSMLLFEDLALVPIVFLLGAMAPNGAAGFDAVAHTLGWGLFAVIGLLIIGRFIFPHLFAQAARTKSPELFLSASLLIVILASLVTALAGLSPIVGALVAGLTIAGTEYQDEVETVTAPFRGLALGVFLISVGMSLDLAYISGRWPMLALAVVGVILAKALVTTMLLRSAGIRKGLATETGVLMGSPSETTLIVLAAAAQAALIDADTAAFWQIVTAIGLTFTPLLARIGHDIAQRIEHGGSLSYPAEAGDSARRTVLVGYGRVGRMVADMLDIHNEPWIAIDGDVDAVVAARAEGKPVHFGNAARPQLLEGLDLDRADAVVLTMDHPAQLIRLTRWLRERHPDLTIIARARDADHAAQLYTAGASDAVPDTLESSLQLSEAVLVDLGKAMGPVIASIHEKRDELRAAIKQQAELDETPRLGAMRREV